VSADQTLYTHQPMTAMKLTRYVSECVTKCQSDSTASYCPTTSNEQWHSNESSSAKWV